jgi:ribose 5-phosphate isomerase B
MAQVYEYEDIFIGSDHGGFALKAALIAQTQGTGLSLHDLGPRALSPGDDYPHYAFQVAQAVAMRQAAAQPYLGVLCCKSGAGMVIAANKVAGVRAVEAISVEQVKRTRDHNDANVLCFGAELLDEKTALECLLAFVSTPFSAADRHVRRLKHIAQFEQETMTTYIAIE